MPKGKVDNKKFKTIATTQQILNKNVIEDDSKYDCINKKIDIKLCGSFANIENENRLNWTTSQIYII